MVTGALSGGPGLEAHTALSAARCRARVHRLQYFCRRRVWASGVERRLRSIFQAELDHFRCARPAQLRDKGQHEIDACRDAAPGQDIAVPDNAALIHDGTEDRKQRSEEHTSELQSRVDLVCRLLLEKKKEHK